MSADRDYFVSFPDCPKCGERGFTWRASDVIAAEGCAECDRCGWMIEPSEKEIEAVAGTLAFDEILAIKKLLWKPSEWFRAIVDKRNEIVKTWHDGVVAANAEWEQRKSKPKPVCHDCEGTGLQKNLFKDSEYTRCHCGA